MKKLEKYELEFEQFLKNKKTEKNRLKIKDILEELTIGNLEKRLYYNYILAKKFYSFGDLDSAKVCINRAWLFSSFDEGLLPLYIDIHEKLDDTGSIYLAYKRLGMCKEKEGDIAKALEYFNKAHYTNATYKKVDEYEYDFDIIDSIERMATSYRYKTDKKIHERAKIAFLVYGATHPNSALLRVNLDWLREIDKSQKEVKVFIIDQSKNIYKNKHVLQNIKQIEDIGHSVEVFEEREDATQRLLDISKAIRDFEADVLVTGAAMAKYEHTFIVATKPAPKIVGFLYGPPEQFCYPFMDEVTSPTYHTLLDTPAKNNIFKPIVYKSDIELKPIKRETIGLYKKNQIILSMGRYTKFQHEKYWSAIQEVLKQDINIIYIVAGIEKEQIKKFLIKEVERQIICLGWVDNVRSYLQLADIVIDTYPSGGGLTLLDAMSYGIPTILFENDFEKKYNQNSWSLEYEFNSVQELVVKRDDFEKLKNLICYLLSNKDKSTELGLKQRQNFRNNFLKHNVLGRVACLGQSLFNKMYRSRKNFYLQNQQKLRLDIFLEKKNLLKPDKIKEFIIENGIYSILKKEEKNLWEEYFKQGDFDFFIMDSFEELAEQKFTHKKEKWSFCTYYSQIEHSKKFNSEFLCEGLLDIDKIENVYSEFFDYFFKQVKDKKFIFIHFPTKFDNRENFKNRGKKILEVIEKMAEKYKNLFSISLDEEDVFQYDKSIPYHFTEETEYCFVKKIKECLNDK